MNKNLLKANLLGAVVVGSLSVSAQCAAGESELYITTSGGSYATEKWVDVTTGIDGTGTVAFAQGNGTYGDSPGLLTNQAFCVTNGTDYYFNAYDAYSDGWDGTTYEVTDGSGAVIVNNGGNSPSNAATVDVDGSWESKAVEIESSEMFNYTPPSCVGPNSLMVTNLTATSADFGWSQSGGATEWEVVSGAPGFTPMPSGMTTMSNPQASGVLTASTDYEFYVRTVCAVGDTSDWSGPFAFTTPCLSSALPWTEDFESLTSFGTTVFPACWSKENGDWQTSDDATSSYDANALSGDYFLRNRWSATNEFIWTPGFDLIAGESYDFSFWWAGDTYDGWTGDVFVNTDQNSTGATQVGSSFVTSTEVTSSTYQEELYRYQAPTSGTYYFAVRVNADGGPWDISFDDFGLSQTPPCPDPSDLMTTWVDNDSVAFSWTAGYLENNWNVEVGVDGFTPGTGTATYTGTSTVALDTAGGLSQITDYQIYIQADCGGGDMSAWVGPIDFTSLPNCAAPSNLVAQVISPDSVSLSWTAGSTGETEWTIEYGENGFTPGSGTFVSVMTNTFDTIPMLDQNTTYDFYLLGNCSLTDSSLWVGPETVTTGLFCNNVSGLSATTVVDTAFLSWTAGSNAETMWNVEYGPVGFTLGSGTMYSTMENNADTLVGLLGSASYQYYVQAACASGDTSLFTGPFTFNMPLTNDDACDAIELAVDGQTLSFSSVGSTSQGEPINGGGGSSTWFYFVHPASNGVTASLCGSGFDTKIYGFDYGVCGDFSTYTELAYNDDACGLQSEIELCGTPGDTIAVMVDGFGGSSGSFVITLSEINLNAGTDAMLDICALDSTELYTVVTDTDSTGTWSFDFNPNAITGGDVFVGANVPAGTHEVSYILAVGCAADTATATLNVVAAGQSGTAVTPFTVCNSDVFLPNGLTGSVETGGTWSDDSGTGLLAGANGNVFVANGLPVGSYPFTYTVSNGVCPDASTTVDVILTNCTSVDENSIEFTVYPNPNEGTFNLTSTISEVVTISVLDVQGKVVYNNKMNITGGTPQVITLDNVETGMYILKVASESNVSTQSFIVK